MKNLKIGRVFFDRERGYPVIISYVNHEQNCVRWICFVDNEETDNIPIITKEKPNRRLEDLVSVDEEKTVRDYLSCRKEKTLEKVNNSSRELLEQQKKHEEIVRELCHEFAFEKEIMMTLEKFHKKLPKE